MTIIASDTFTRANQSGWGTASDAETWAVVLGNVANFSIASNEGQISGATGIQVAYLGSQTSADMELLVRFSVSAILDTALVLLRGTASNTHYRIRQVNGQFEIRRAVAGATTLLANTNFTLTAGSYYWIRARIQGSTISANIWADGGSEGAGWMNSVVDSSPITGAGQFGLGVTLNATGDSAKYDHLTVNNLAGVALTATMTGVGTLTGTITTPGAHLAASCAGVGTLTGTLVGTTYPTNNPYGVTIGLHPGSGNAGSPYAYWSLLFADMRAKGMTWLRFQLPWFSIEFPQGTYTWTVLDDAVSQCNANNIKILFTFQNVPAWVLLNTAQQANTEPFFLPDPTLMAGFATQVATRYDGAHGHGKIDAFGYNEEFSIHFTDIVSTLTLNQTLTSGTPYTSFTINAAGFTPQIGTKLYIGGYNSANVATVSGNVTLNDVTVTVTSFTPNATYNAGTTINIGWVGLYNNTLYPGLYGSGTATTPSNKSQPARDFHFASPVVAAVTAAIRAVNPTVPIGMPVIWWPQPINSGVPNTPVSNYTASLQTLYNDGCKGLFSFIDFHYYSNSQAPLVGSGSVSTITAAMADLRTVAVANGDATIPIYVTEFGWQVPNDVPDGTTQATYYGQVLDAVRAGDTNPNGKIFFYTLDYNPSTTSQSTLVKWNGSSYDYQPAWTTWGNYIIQYPQWGAVSTPITVPTGAYSVFIGGQAVFVEAGTLQINNSIGRRSQASFHVLTGTSTHYQQYQQVAIYDQNAILVFSGYIIDAPRHKPGWQAYLVHEITCIDQHYLADKRIVAQLYRNQTCGFIVADLITNILSAEGVTVGQIATGATVPVANFGYCTVADAMDALVAAASASGIPHYWQIDQNKALWFVPYTTIVGPSVDGTTIDDGRRSGVEPISKPGNPKYRNTQYAVGGVDQTGTNDETVQGDGQTRAFTFKYALAGAPSLFQLNGVTKTLGTKGQTGFQYYWAQGDPVIAQDSGQTILVSTDRLHMQYVGQFPSVFTNNNAAQITAQQTLDGTSGINEAVLEDKTIASKADGQAKVNQQLTQYCLQGEHFVFATLDNRYQAGQLITVNYAPFGYANTQLLVEEVDISDQADGINLWNTVNGVIGPYDTTWVEFFGNLFNKPTTIANSISLGVSLNVPLAPATTLAPSTTLAPG